MYLMVLTMESSGIWHHHPHHLWNFFPWPQYSGIGNGIMGLGAMVGGDCGGGNHHGTDYDDEDNRWHGGVMVVGLWQ